MGKYTNFQGGGDATYRFASDTYLILRYDYRYYTTQNAIYRKDSSRLSLGFAYSPGERPLATW